MKISVGQFVTGVIIGVEGIALICIYVNWQAALGIFLLAWGNNIGRPVP